ncbi:SMI1/KNR4 family protein [Zavarzinia aquatilis]|uniref:Knr4/Smi1-like domain-containing protein n=1 Tax=Zavarzinia aquatilis TaxID=2211142 RepID=A0A317E9H6_9PROT|nr:SMI1/KNR4 family protein [Zavarzinia aquatilis]PWR22886.1 hypothetical protein DKG74_10725 [Zavarzinia aquatilis]
MAIDDLFEAFKIIDNNSEYSHFSGKKTDSLIFSAEAALGVSFPESYKLFLRKYGCGSAFGEEFYGIAKNDLINSTIPDAIWLTLRQRSVDCVPSRFVFVYGFGDGSYAVLDCGQGSSRGEVVFWEPGASTASDRLEILAQDFGEFMLSVLKNASEDSEVKDS